MSVWNMFRQPGDEDYEEADDATVVPEAVNITSKLKAPPKPRCGTGFVGLKNQGATCYMNSLLQAQFMTPEFRNFIFQFDPEKQLGAGRCSWITKPDEAALEAFKQEKNAKRAMGARLLPLQLQRLFAELRALDVDTRSTTNLTEIGFQWTGNDGRVQHDVQDLNRNIMEWLEKSVGDLCDDHTRRIQDIFTSTSQYYTACLHCGEKAKSGVMATDLDLIVPVQNNSDLADAFYEMQKSDTVSGVTCESATCGGEKRDKSRYWSLEASPPVLVLSLKRFGINFANMSRFKVNTKFAFPLVLDIGALKRGSNTETSGKGADDDDDEDGTHRGSKKIDQNAPTDKDALTSNIRNNMIWLEQLKTKNGEAKARRRYQRLTSRNPEDVYELYAIVIHSGGAYSGHYHAYIKDFHAGTPDSPARAPVHETSDASAAPKPLSATDTTKGGGANLQTADAKGRGVKTASAVAPTPKSSSNKNAPKPPQQHKKQENRKSGPSATAAPSGIDPLQLLRDLLQMQPGNKCELSVLGSLIQKRTRSSWRKLFEDTHGKMGAFVRAHSRDFKLDRSMVHLRKRTAKPTTGADGWTKVGEDAALTTQAATPTKSGGASKEPRPSSKPSLGNQTKGHGTWRSDKHLQDQWGVWYDFNDSRVTPLSIFGIEKQFEGKENAYMLFYRRIAADTLSAKNTTEIETALANHDAAAPEGVSARDILLGKAAAPTGKPPPPALLPLPSFWQRYVDARNKSFTLRRDLYDRLANQISVHVYRPECFEVCTDGLRFVEVKNESPEESKEVDALKISLSVDARIEWPALKGLLTDKLGGDIGQCRFIHHVNLQRPDDGFYLGQEFSGPSPSADQQKNVSSGDQGNLVEGSMLLLLPSTLDTCDDSAALQNMQRAALDFVEQGAAQQQVLRKILQSSEAALRDAQAAMDEVNGIVHDDGIAVDTKESTPPSGGAKQEPTPRPQKIQATATPAPAPGPKTWANLAAKNGKNTAHSGGRGRGRGTNSGRGGNRGGREQPQTQTKSLKVDPSARKGRAQEISSDEPLPMVISAEARKKLETRLASAKRQFAKYRAQMDVFQATMSAYTEAAASAAMPAVVTAKDTPRTAGPSKPLALHLTLLGPTFKKKDCVSKETKQLCHVTGRAVRMELRFYCSESFTMPQLRQTVLAYALREGHGIFTDACLHPKTASKLMQLYLVHYGKGHVLSRFEPILPNYYKRDKPLKTWDIEDQSELVCELVPNMDIVKAVAPPTLANVDGGSTVVGVVTDIPGAARLELAKQEEHRRKHSLQVTITVDDSLVQSVNRDASSPGAEQLRTEQGIQLDLGTKAEALLNHVVKTYRLTNAVTDSDSKFRLRLMNNTSLLGSSLDEDGMLCLPSDIVHSNDLYVLERGRPLADDELCIRVGLIIGNNRSAKGGGGSTTAMIEIIAPNQCRMTEFKAEALRATWAMNSPKIAEPNQWRFRKVTAMGDMGDLLTEHGDISQAGLSNGSMVWMEQGKPPKKDAVNISVKLWLPCRKPLSSSQDDGTETGIPLCDMSAASTNASAEGKTDGGDDFPAPPDDNSLPPALPDSTKCCDPDVTPQSPQSPTVMLDPETVLAESNALRSDALLSIRVFEALAGTSLAQVKNAILGDPRVKSAVEQGLCGEQVRRLMLAGELTSDHVRFRILEQRNMPGKVFKGVKRHSLGMKDLGISSGKTGKIGRHFVAELLAKPEDLSDNAVVLWVQKRSYPHNSPRWPPLGITWHDAPSTVSVRALKEFLATVPELGLIPAEQQVLAKFHSKGKNMHTWQVLYDTPAAAASGKVGGGSSSTLGTKGKAKGAKSAKRLKPKTLKQYAVDDGSLICVRDLRDDGGGSAPDYFMRFEDECAKQGAKAGGAKPQKQGAAKGGKRGARARGPELDINQPKFFGGDPADVDIDEEEPESPKEPAFQFEASQQLLLDMGFSDVEKIQAALLKCNGDAQQAVNFLV